MSADVNHRLLSVLVGKILYLFFSQTKHVFVDASCNSRQKFICGIDFMDRFGLKTLDVPEGTYAVFQTPHTKYPVEDYMKLRENIATDWLPGSGYTLRKAPELAIYHWYTTPDNNKKRYIEIWIPVKD